MTRSEDHQREAMLPALPSRDNHLLKSNAIIEIDGTPTKIMAISPGSRQVSIGREVGFAAIKESSVDPVKSYFNTQRSAQKRGSQQMNKDRTPVLKVSGFRPISGKKKRLFSPLHKGANKSSTSRDNSRSHYQEVSQSVQDKSEQMRRDATLA